VNIQGDEPFVTGASLDVLVDALAADPDLAIATLAEKIESADEIFDPSVVKVVLARDRRACTSRGLPSRSIAPSPASRRRTFAPRSPPAPAASMVISSTRESTRTGPTSCSR